MASAEKPEESWSSLCCLASPNDKVAGMCTEVLQCYMQRWTNGLLKSADEVLGYSDYKVLKQW